MAAAAASGKKPNPTEVQQTSSPKIPKKTSVLVDNKRGTPTRDSNVENTNMDKPVCSHLPLCFLFQSSLY